MRKHVRYEYNLSAKEKEKNPLLKVMRTKLLNIKPVVDYHRFSFIITGTMHIQTNQNVPYGKEKITRHRVMNIHELVHPHDLLQKYLLRFLHKCAHM